MYIYINIYCSSRNTGCAPPANQKLRRHYSLLYSENSTNYSQSNRVVARCVYL